MYSPGYHSNENMYACSFWSQFLITKTALIRPLLHMTHLIDMQYLLQINIHLVFIISVKIKIEHIQYSSRVFSDRFTIFRWFVTFKTSRWHKMHYIQYCRLMNRLWPNLSEDWQDLDYNTGCDKINLAK